MWIAKVLLQFMIAHLPFGERLNHTLQRINAQRLGGDEGRTLKLIPDVAAAVRTLRTHHDIHGAVILEVGTGWSPLPTVLLSLCGARAIYTFDHQRHLRSNLLMRLLKLLQTHASLISQALDLNEKTLRAQLDMACAEQDMDNVLKKLRITYYAPGDCCRTGLPNHSVDVCFSYAVLEHVPAKLISGHLDEARRVLRSTGVWFALIGLHDHYAGFDRRVSKVNFLKFPEWLWAFFVYNNISYHNRWRQPEFVEAIDRAGGKIVFMKNTVDPEDVRIVRSMRLATRFQRFTAEENAISRAEIVASFS